MNYACLVAMFHALKYLLQHHFDPFGLNRTLPVSQHFAQVDVAEFLDEPDVGVREDHISQLNDIGVV